MPVAAPPTVEERLRLLDGHWAARQLQLYDLGGLDDFVRRGASHALLESADDLAAWATAPMGGFRLVSATSDELTWLDLGSMSERVTPNLGGGVMVGLGHHAIGWLVPTSLGELFESRPQALDRVSAEQVAAWPERWLEVLRTAYGRRRQRWDDEESGRVEVDPDHDDFEGLSGLDRHEPDLLTDMAAVSWLCALWQDATPGTPLDEMCDDDLGPAVLRTARRLLRGEPDPEAPVWAFPEPDRWAALSAALTRPAVVAELDSVLSPPDGVVLAELAARLPEPAAGVCRRLAGQAREAV